jgi:ADP-ribose pyrophosphatase YjhB (NUDIX family)
MTRRYPARPIVGIGICLLRHAEVLLIRRGRAPALGAWSLPGGAQRLGETAEAAARRELWEETATTAGRLHLAATVDSIHPDASGNIEYHYTIIDFAGRWEAGEATAGGDASEVAWVGVDGLAAYGVGSEIQGVVARARVLLAD